MIERGRENWDRGKNKRVARWWELIKHRSNEKSKNKNNNSSNSLVFGLWPQKKAIAVGWFWNTSHLLCIFRPEILTHSFFYVECHTKAKLIPLKGWKNKEEPVGKHFWLISSQESPFPCLSLPTHISLSIS